MNCLIFLQFIKNTNFKNANNSLLIHYKQLLKFINKLRPKNKKIPNSPETSGWNLGFFKLFFQKN
ncbi:hypothetical protein DCO46_18705 [Flavobacterium sp. HTF]|nr:hypothetical protein DCO46_18705 [Flavobacterium sp. HTF]